MSEIDAIKSISDILEELQPEERLRVLVWAQSRYGGAHINISPASARIGGAQQARNTSSPKAKIAKKAKTIISMDKSLNLSPQGKQTAVDFAAAKAPSNAKEKCVVAIYYLRETIGLTQVSAQAVFTFFKTVHWAVPANLRNMLQQAGSAGWLDTADSDDIKLTSLGENLIEHDLPYKTKVK